VRGGWILTEHAKLRMQEMGLNRVAVGLVANDPEVTYTQGDRGWARVAQRGDLAVVFNPNTREILTVLWRSQERYQRRALSA
jgi:hypothetical protein